MLLNVLILTHVAYFGFCKTLFHIFRVQSSGFEMHDICAYLLCDDNDFECLVNWS